MAWFAHDPLPPRTAVDPRDDKSLSWDALLVKTERRNPRNRMRSMRLRSLWLGAGPDNLGAGHDWWRAGLKGELRGGDRQQRLRAARLLRCREEDWQRGKEIPGERDVLH
jgi:hypothetical protein